MKRLILTLLCAITLEATTDTHGSKCEFIEYLAKESRQRLSDLHFSQVPQELKKQLYDLEYAAYLRHSARLKECEKPAK